MAVKIFILTVLCFLTGQAVEFRCSFDTVANYNVYRCTVIEVNSIESTTLEKVVAVHDEGRSDYDVEYLWIRDHLLPFVPNGIEQFFSRLRMVLFWSTHLLTISPEDLRQFPRLTHFWSYDNNITSLNSDLFAHNPRARLIEFQNNKIQHIGNDLVTRLSELTRLSFFGNPCTTEVASSREEVLQLAPRLSIYCRPL